MVRVDRRRLALGWMHAVWLTSMWIPMSLMAYTAVTWWYVGGGWDQDAPLGLLWGGLEIGCLLAALLVPWAAHHWLRRRIGPWWWNERCGWGAGYRGAARETAIVSSPRLKLRHELSYAVRLGFALALLAPLLMQPEFFGPLSCKCSFAVPRRSAAELMLLCGLAAAVLLTHVPRRLQGAGPRHATRPGPASC
jgi:hypothetical protein